MRIFNCNNGVGNYLKKGLSQNLGQPFNNHMEIINQEKKVKQKVPSILKTKKINL